MYEQNVIIKYAGCRQIYLSSDKLICHQTFFSQDPFEKKCNFLIVPDLDLLITMIWIAALVSKEANLHNCLR